MDADGRTRRHGGHEVLVQVFGDERHDRSEQLAHPHQDVVEHLERGLLLVVESALPELAPPPPHVPLRQIVVDKRINRVTARRI